MSDITLGVIGLIFLVLPLLEVPDDGRALGDETDRASMSGAFSEPITYLARRFELCILF